MNLQLIYANSGFFLRAAILTGAMFVASVGFTTIIAITFGGLATSKNAIVRGAFRIIIEFLRDVPLIVNVFFVFFGAPAFGLRLGPIEATVLSLSLWGGANGAEIVRGGINSVAKHQIESARALGLSRFRIFASIVVPQAVRPIIPAYAGLCTVLLQSTSLGALVGAPELLKSAQIIIERSAYFQGGMPGITVYTFILIVYFAAGSTLTRFTKRLERRMSRSAGLH
ncbi:amino acid ABC transporter permease [Paraburkholderia sartisoli]|uniref:Amino acid ABC transporter membrane protein 2, PAAT family n=1 Tax=Paraburkholderia sartisoli TaxID=83784 RepID=A0A1H4D1I6_9BURK|nr:amino acid ABC transporter permease [Paraburkholderia sartisoli]SEA66615.1 amino acid ABC transporter membrane protein 2, PAAT family [Paraburkholderia sartisoli]